ncbi:hypothetical protein OS493_022759 [Desmophyllum pertusum]|uniref:Insulin-like domain-containing protein n=1 Tax=Desmophyllum pertusum TaxID=174260 RepID=A0A9W9YE40_9CNID|nr:hypothetical protein OS493_022759 [Desmophyllum pertusum]
MSHCYKFLLLVSIVLYIHAISAKEYDIKVCWSMSQFRKILDRRCSSSARKRSIRKEALVKSESEAKNFLTKLSRREPPTIETRQSTDYHEECCNEGCKMEEIAEYCWQ